MTYSKMDSLFMFLKVNGLKINDNFLINEIFPNKY